MEKAIAVLAALLLGPLVLVFLWLMFVMVPVMIYTEAECLRNGYPKYHVSIGLERYCSNFDGAVTVKVDRADKSAR